MPAPAAAAEHLSPLGAPVATNKQRTPAADADAGVLTLLWQDPQEPGLQVVGVGSFCAEGKLAAPVWTRPLWTAVATALGPASAGPASGCSRRCMPRTAAGGWWRPQLASHFINEFREIDYIISKRCSICCPQVLAEDGSWRLVAPVAGALTVNVGDMFQVMWAACFGLVGRHVQIGGCCWLPSMGLPLSLS